ncbi:hypothetical protein CLOM_g18372 [Closterium sp. NIES-68]|nr:hypothetical protein CLOM_g18372 [Closterium sp. NIES-68]GJP80837.1 hypothetical protein CLOP_g11033 [Closterium sp. NIES-67]
MARNSLLRVDPSHPYHYLRVMLLVVLLSPAAATDGHTGGLVTGSRVSQAAASALVAAGRRPSVARRRLAAPDQGGIMLAPSQLRVLLLLARRWKLGEPNPEALCSTWEGVECNRHGMVTTL